MSRATVPFYRPSIGEAEIAEVVSALRSGWLTTGPKARQFEADFAAYIGDDVGCVAVNSCTAALHLALEAIGICPGDEVICPTLTFTATAEVIRYLGATPVIIDCDPKTLNVSPEAIEAALTSRTKAVMPVHFAGRPCDMASICKIARSKGVWVADDAAHALPAHHNGRIIGNCGADATAFSFYANKTITTGEGGMLVSRNPAVLERARKMRLHGIDRDVLDRFTNLRTSWRYDVIAPGYKYNMTDIAAALGIHQLKRADEFCMVRGQLASIYDDAFADLPLVLPPKAAKADEHSWHLYIVRLREDAPLDRDSFISKMLDQGVSCSVHYTPLHRLTYWRESLNLKLENYPAANAVFERTISLPLFVAMTEVEQQKVIAAVRNTLTCK